MSQTVVTPELRQALVGLHDLQLGEPAVAAPWLMMLAALMVLLALAAAYRWTRPRQRMLRQLKRLRLIGRDRVSADQASFAVRELAGLLRRAAVSHATPPMPAGLTGMAWLQWLDARAPQADRGALMGEPGQWLLTLPYAPHSVASPLLPDRSQLDALFGLSERWLRSNC